MSLAAREQGFDRVLQGFAESDSGSQSRAKGDGEFLEFDAEACVGFQSERRVSVEQVPDLNEKFAGDGCDGNIAIAFAGKKFPTPLAQRGIASAAHDGVSALDEEVADVASSASSDPQADVFAFAALALPGVESDVGDEFLGTVEAPYVGHVVMQGQKWDRSDFLLCSLPEAGTFCPPPERLPRRAVRGLGAHSPHQAGWGVSHGLADGSG